MTGPDERKSESWIAWITLLLAALAWLCAVIVSATKGIGETLRIHESWIVTESAIQVPMLLASPVYAALGVLSHFALRRPGYHSRKNTVGLVLAAVWLFLAFGVRVETAENVHGWSRCMSNLKQIGLALHTYSQDNDEKFPPDLEQLCFGYAPDPQLFVCPRTRKHVKRFRWPPPEEVRQEYLTYRYVAGLNSTDSAAYVLAFDDEDNHEGHGVNALHIDGHVQLMPDIEGLHEKLRKQAAALKAKGREMRIAKVSWDRFPSGPAHVWPPWWMGWAGAFTFVAVGFIIPAGGLILWERVRRWRLARRE